MGGDSEGAPARGGTIGNARRVRFAHHQRKDYLYFAFVAACGPLQTLFSWEGSWREAAFAAPAFCESAALRGSGLALSVTAYAVPPLPKGEALAKPEALHLNREVYRHAKGSPFGGAGALAPERARTFAGGRSLPLGGAVAQRLRGYKWRSEKSVKAIAPTGAALAFLCFDFFFRIVKGEQPLARCGVGGVQR